MMSFRNVLNLKGKKHTGNCLLICALSSIIFAFFIVSRCGFFLSDDYGMGEDHFCCFRDVIEKTIWFYKNWGGGLFIAFSQYVFCGLFQNKLWFDIANTFLFACLLIVCSRLIVEEGAKKSDLKNVLLFALLFWFLCPKPRETLFWAVGSMAYLWPTTLVFFYLLLFLRFKGTNSSFWTKIVLFALSLFAATSIIPCVSVCGAFAVYYLFRIKEFKGDAIPLVLGFVVGTVVLVFAPGNFVRASKDMLSFSEKMKDLVAHPVLEVLKYKAWWLLFFAYLLAFVLNKSAALDWTRKNAFLLIAVIWSVIAFSFVFRPANRALFSRKRCPLFFSFDWF